uniref:NADH dehydrogenase [ubiquinone] 1 alpha subcomplex subunit 6 n=1 Tax=Timema tahoe TaxID=61484 RepID=A0A7R9IME9_9NEOP|nr:unnamed protein product [Timema tahoe]
MAAREATRTAVKNVRPILSIDSSEAKKRALNLYKAWYRQMPYVVMDYDIPKTVPQLRQKLREEFEKNKHITDIRVIDMLVIKWREDGKTTSTIPGQEYNFDINPIYCKPSDFDHITTKVDILIDFHFSGRCVVKVAGVLRFIKKMSKNAEHINDVKLVDETMNTKDLIYEDEKNPFVLLCVVKVLSWCLLNLTNEIPYLFPDHFLKFPTKKCSTSGNGTGKREKLLSLVVSLTPGEHTMRLYTLKIRRGIRILVQTREEGLPRKSKEIIDVHGGLFHDFTDQNGLVAYLTPKRLKLRCYQMDQTSTSPEMSSGARLGMQSRSYEPGTCDVLSRPPKTPT